MFSKTHRSITSGLTKMISDLSALTKANAMKAKAKTSQIAQLTEDIRHISMEDTKCINSIRQLEKIVGGKD